jgi:hypothetical protein
LLNEGPNSVIKNTIERINNKLFKVTYIPLEVGFVNINIKWNGKDIVNSPFTVAVTNTGIKTELIHSFVLLSDR